MNRKRRRTPGKVGAIKPPGKTAAAELPPGTANLLAVGLKHHQAGRVAEAESCYRQFLAEQPDHADALHLLGVVAHQTGRHDFAVELISRAIKQNRQNAAYYCNLGVALKQQGKLEPAIAAYRQAIAVKPDYAEAHSNLGAALHDQGKLDEAVAACRRAIDIKPDFAEAHSNLGNALKDQGKFDEAIAAFRQAIRIKPGLVEAHSNLGIALRAQGKVDETVVACRQAIALKPNFADAHYNLALALMALGRLSESRDAAEQAVHLAPRNAEYRRLLGDVMRFVAGDPHLAAMEQLAQESASLSIEDRIRLHFALGKAYEDVGRHAEAFRQWLNGNALKRRQLVYNEAATLRALDRTRAVFTSELIRTWQKVGQPSSVPVFIFGMPRSGSTLVEQILASHPQVFGGGELTHFERAIKGIRTTPGGPASFPEQVLGMTDEDFHDLGVRYLAEIEGLAPTAIRIADKMPSNFVCAGLIHLALPNAAMIHTTRDPIDTCLSCFSKPFAEEKQSHTYDLAELGRYYRHYQALMAHWHRVLPAGRILDVRYEEVVADLEGQARRIVAHCGLDWDPRCLVFHQTERPVLTASASQVRQPIYNSSIGRWHVYKEFLAPLLAELGIAGPP